MKRREPVPEHLRGYLLATYGDRMVVAIERAAPPPGDSYAGSWMAVVQCERGHRARYAFGALGRMGACRGCRVETPRGA